MKYTATFEIPDDALRIGDAYMAVRVYRDGHWRDVFITGEEYHQHGDEPKSARYLTKAMEKAINIFAEIADESWVNKPASYAMYHAWKWIDGKEGRQ